MNPYRQLASSEGEIRLLELQPAKKPSAAIVCKLKYEFLSSKPNYEALSYVWGEKEGGSDIKLDDCYFRVFENCDAALRRLRKRSSSRVIWIDAICINQKNESEKDVQLLLMKDIYQQAQRVCVWLGELSDSSIIGVKSIQGSLAMGWHQWRVDRKFGKPTLPVRESLSSSISMQNRADLVTEHELGEVKELLNRPWFSRVWIMQEAVLASEIVVMCGPETMEWEEIGTVIRRSWVLKGLVKVFDMFVNPKDIFPDETYQVICLFRKMHSAGEWDGNLYKLLYDYRHLNCGKPQDRIYGFLGLTSATKDLGIKPNYKSSAAEVYTSFARTVIGKTRSLDLLNCRREWKGDQVSFPQRAPVAYSLIDQSRYHDLHALITDGLEHPPRRGWARLPPGWERIQSEGKRFYFRNHNNGTDHEKSPLEGEDPIPAQYFADQRHLPKGWTKEWTNVGQSRVKFAPDSIDQHKRLIQDLEEFGLNALPSWVPNWAARTEYDPDPLLDWSDPLPRYWSAGKFDAANIMVSPDPEVLALEGLIIDTISAIACPWHPTSDIGPFSRKGIEELEIWEALAVADVGQCPYASAGGRKNALWRTLIADWAGDRSAPEDHWIYIETWYDKVGWRQEIPNLTSAGIWEAASLEVRTGEMESKMNSHFMDLLADTSTYQEYVTSSSVLRIIKDSFSVAIDRPKKYGEYVRRIRRACAHRALFVTSRGYLGLAPWNAQQGDMVCILKGGKTPYLLRLPPAGSVYQLVGEAYVHGIMSGEALASEESSNDWRRFNLR